MTGHQVAHGRAPRDSEKMGYGHTAGRVQNQISRRVRDAARRLETIERAQIPAPPEPLRFHASVLAAGDGTEAIVTADQVEVPGRLRVGHLEVLARERLLVSGPNGAGKSTLLAVLAGNLSCTGAVWRRPDLRVGLLSQDSVFPDAQRTARQVFDATVGTERAEVVALSSLGLLAPTDLDRPVAELSVGQRRRLGLAVLVADPPELLLLDEPTNHLSPRLCDELEEALGTGPGAIVVASHDRRLRSRWQGREITLAATVTG